MANYFLTSMLTISMTTLLVADGATKPTPLTTLPPTVNSVVEKPVIFYGTVWEISRLESGKISSKLADQFKATKVIYMSTGGGLFYVDADTNETYRVDGPVIVEINDKPTTTKPKFLVDSE